MTNSEIITLLADWTPGWPNVFRINYSFFDPDILVLFRLNEEIFEVDLNKSTTKHFKQFTKEELTRRLKNGTLQYLRTYSTNINYNSERTKGCTCGAWATENPNNHSPICDLYRRDM